MMARIWALVRGARVEGQVPRSSDHTTTTTYTIAPSINNDILTDTYAVCAPTMSVVVSIARPST